MSGSRAPGWLAATTLVLGVASCAQIIGLQPFDGGGGGGAGGRSAGGGSPTSTGARMSGSGAGDAGGSSSDGGATSVTSASSGGGGGGACGAGLQCFANPGNGWSDPFALVVDCQSWNGATKYHAAPPNAQCDTGGCSCPQDCPVTIELDTNENDCSILDSATGVATVCTPFILSGSSMKAITPSATGNCTAQGTASAPALVDVAVCTPPGGVVACGNEKCLPGFPGGAPLCVSRSDAALCPPAFPQPHPEVYQNTPANPCQCKCAAQSVSCAGVVKFYGFSNCTGSPSVQLAVDGNCLATPTFNPVSARYAPDATCHPAPEPYGPPADVFVCCTQ